MLDNLRRRRRSIHESELKNPPHESELKNPPFSGYRKTKECPLLVTEEMNLPRRGARLGPVNHTKAGGPGPTGYYFKSALQTALERDRQRCGKSLIPEKGIIGAYRKLEPPS